MEDNIRQDIIAAASRHLLLKGPAAPTKAKIDRDMRAINKSRKVRGGYK